jgi:hypothetical protein
MYAKGADYSRNEIYYDDYIEPIHMDRIEVRLEFTQGSDPFIISWTDEKERLES